MHGVVHGARDSEGRFESSSRSSGSSRDMSGSSRELSGGMNAGGRDNRH
jgi:hypothetical protein